MTTVHRWVRATTASTLFRTATAWLALVLSACGSPPTQGIFLHRERGGAAVLHLDKSEAGRVTGEITLTRVGQGGGMRVSAHKLLGSRNGDVLKMRDAAGGRVTVLLTRTTARLTTPMGEVLLLDRGDLRREDALLASLAEQARRAEK